MVLWTLALAGLVDLAAGAVFAYVGHRLARRHAGEHARASLMFALWWQALAGTILITGARNTLAGLGFTTPLAGALFGALNYVFVLLLCLGLWGLLYYLVVLFTGRRGVFWPLGVFYLAYFAVAAAVLLSLGPATVVAGKWFAQVAYANTLRGPLLAVLLLLLLLPQILAAVAYGTLALRLKDATRRYRVGVVSVALVVWLGLQLAAPFLGLGRHEAWAAGGRFVGLAAALAVYWAYHPPAWVRQRHGIEGLPTEVGVAPRRLSELDLLRLEAVRKRAGELV
jgi:hypothetical protein